MWSTFPLCNFLLGSINKPSCSVDMTDYHDLILYKGHCSLKQPSHLLSALSHTSFFQERWEGAVFRVCTCKQPGQVKDLFPWWSLLSFHYFLLCAFVGELWSKGLLCSPGFYRPTRNKLFAYANQPTQSGYLGESFHPELSRLQACLRML